MPYRLSVSLLAVFVLSGGCSGSDATDGASTDASAGAAGADQGKAGQGQGGSAAVQGGKAGGAQGGTSGLGGGAGQTAGAGGQTGGAAGQAGGGAGQSGKGGQAGNAGQTAGGSAGQTAGGSAGQSGAGGAGQSGAGGNTGGASGAPPAAQLVFPVVCPAPGFPVGKTTPPVVLDGMSNVVLDGVAVQNPSGPCIVVKNGAHVTLRNSTVGPCKGHGIQVSNASDVHVENVVITGATGNGVDAYKVTSLTVERSCIEHVASGVYAQESTGVAVERNAVKNVQGPFPRGQLVQLNAAAGSGNRIRCNVLDDLPGQSNPEDAINLYKSNGTAASPILVEGNRIRGGGPSTSGGGILLGDGGDSSYQVARGNVLADPGQYGVAVASGTNVTLEGNRVFSAKHPWSNVGLYVWNQYDAACGPVTVTKNQVRWTSKTGQDNPFWNGSQSPAQPTFPVCSGTTIAADNDWAATFDETVVLAAPAVCPLPTGRKTAERTPGARRPGAPAAPAPGGATAAHRRTRVGRPRRGGLSCQLPASGARGVGSF